MMAYWEQAKEEYLAILFIGKVDQRHYGMLINDIQNNHTRGTDQYPRTITAVYDLMVNYQSPTAALQFDQQDQEVSFYTEDDDINNGSTPGKSDN